MNRYISPSVEIMDMEGKDNLLLGTSPVNSLPEGDDVDNQFVIGWYVVEDEELGW